MAGATVPDSRALSESRLRAGTELCMQPETKWYDVGTEQAGVDQFLVQDPDGYLVRFQSAAGRRPVAGRRPAAD